MTLDEFQKAYDHRFPSTVNQATLKLAGRTEGRPVDSGSYSGLICVSLADRWGSNFPGATYYADTTHIPVVQIPVTYASETWDHSLLLGGFVPDVACISGFYAFGVTEGGPFTDPRGTLYQSVADQIGKAELDKDAREVAHQAQADFCIFVATTDIDLSGWQASISDEGVISLDKYHPAGDVLLSLAGGGTAAFSVRRRGGRYSSDIAEFDISERTPKKLREIFASLA